MRIWILAEVFSLQKNNTKILFLISASLGEIDIILPMLAELESQNLDVEILFTTYDMYSGFSDNDFYKHCVSSFKNIKKISYIGEEFHDGKFQLTSPATKKTFKIFYPLVLLIQTPFRLIKKIGAIIKFTFKIINTDIICHEHGLRFFLGNYFYFLNKKLNKTVYMINHGQSYHRKGAPIIAPGSKIKNEALRKSLMLIPDEGSRDYYAEFGLENAQVLGYTKTYPKWRKFLKEYADEKFKNQEEFVLILTRDDAKREQILIDCYTQIREKLGDIKILIKYHPRESAYYGKFYPTYEKYVKLKGWNNVEVTKENVGVLAYKCKLAIAMWSSAVFDMLYENVPSVDYWIEWDDFLKAYPEGSLYRNMGIDSAQNSEEFASFLEKVINNTYKVPAIVEQLKSENNIEKLNELFS